MPWRRKGGDTSRTIHFGRRAGSPRRDLRDLPVSARIVPPNPRDPSRSASISEFARRASSDLLGSKRVIAWSARTLECRSRRGPASVRRRRTPTAKDAIAVPWAIARGPWRPPGSPRGQAARASRRRRNPRPVGSSGPRRERRHMEPTTIGPCQGSDSPRLMITIEGPSIRIPSAALSTLSAPVSWRASES